MTKRRNDKLIQWNIQEIAGKKDKLLHSIEKGSPSIIVIKETMLNQDHKFSISNYNIINKQDTFNRRAHGGVSLLIHESIPLLDEIQLITDIQAVAVEVYFHGKVTVCSNYSSRSHTLSEEKLSRLFLQLPPPVILMGDFNAYNELWGNSTTDCRGHTVAKFTH